MKKIMFLLVCVLAVNMAYAQKYSARNRGVRQASADSVLVTVDDKVEICDFAKYDESHYTLQQNLARAGRFQR